MGLPPFGVTLLRTVLAGLAVLGLDLLTKQLVLATMTLGQSIPVVPGLLHLTYVMNPGAAFGLLAGQRWLFTAISAGTILFILAYARRSEAQAGAWPYALGLIMGGAAGNLVDRLRFGSVVDFLDFFWQDYHWPAFNVADSAIVIGVGLLLLQMVWEGRGGEAPAHD